MVNMVNNNNMYELINETNLITPNFEGVLSAGMVNTTLQQLYLETIETDPNIETNETVINNHDHD